MSERFSMDEMESVGPDETRKQQGFIAAVLGLDDDTPAPALGGGLSLLPLMGAG